MFIRTSAVYYLTRGFASAITLFPFVLIGTRTPLTRRLVIHERIHLRQQLEMLILPFYIWYLIEYLLRLLKFKNGNAAYLNISFEREAYFNDLKKDYLNRRKLWAWISYL